MQCRGCKSSQQWPWAFAANTHTSFKRKWLWFFFSIVTCRWVSQYRHWNRKLTRLTESLREDQLKESFVCHKQHKSQKSNWKVFSITRCTPAISYLHCEIIYICNFIGHFTVKMQTGNKERVLVVFHMPVLRYLIQLHILREDKNKIPSCMCSWSLYITMSTFLWLCFWMLPY